MENVVDNKKKKKIIIVSILIIVALIGITIAYFMSRSVSDEHTITSGNLAITYENENTFQLTGLIPLLESEVLDDAAKISFTVRNTGTLEAYVKINLTDITISNLASYDFKWALYEDTTKITTGNFGSLGNNASINLASNIKLNTSESKNYNVYVWIDETGEDQSSLMKGSFKSKVEVIGLDTKEETLASYILGENNSNVLTTSPTFYDTSTDKGLFVQKDDSEKSEFGFPTYYYRGAVENNYVSFANQTWRIMRINEDGTIKLILNESIFDDMYTGSYIINFSRYENLSLKNEVERWYTNNLTQYDNYIMTSSYCNDWSSTSSSQGQFSYGPLNRKNTLKPIFTCPESPLQLKVGIITADEVIYAGNSNNTYLKNLSGWTMSPSHSLYGEGYIYILSNGGLSSAVPTSGTIPYPFSPIINLKSDVTISGGKGTSTDPYIIEE